MEQAKGTFAVKLTPEEDKTGDAIVGRMTIDKQFSGDLEGTSKGLMVMVGTPVQGSAGYVAIEKVSGTVQGRSGSFYLQHSGLMRRGEGELTIHVIPDSGTEELIGISGMFDIQIDDGKHSYVFEYELADVE